MKGTISVAPNFAYGLCCKRIPEEEVAGLDLSSWQVALCGAEPVQVETLKLFAERFAKAGFQAKALTPAYGLAEATLAVAVSSRSEGPRALRFDREKLERENLAVPSDDGMSLVSSGQAIPQVQIEIRDEEGRKIPEGQAGRVWVKGPNVMLGYLDNPEATKIIIVEGWLDTGDRAFFHEGELYLCGRYKDLIIIRGKNFDPAALEESLEGIAGLRTGCAVAFGETEPHSDTESLIILAEIQKEPKVDHDSVAAAIREKISTTFQLSVSEIALVSPGTLPRTSSGKKQRLLAKSLWKENALKPPEKRLGWVYLREKVKGYLQHKLT